MKSIAFGLACIVAVQASPIENFITQGLLKYTGLVMTKKVGQKDSKRAEDGANRSGYPKVKNFGWNS